MVFASKIGVSSLTWNVVARSKVGSHVGSAVDSEAGGIQRRCHCDQLVPVGSMRRKGLEVLAAASGVGMVVGAFAEDTAATEEEDGVGLAIKVPAMVSVDNLRRMRLQVRAEDAVADSAVATWVVGVTSAMRAAPV